MTLKPSIGAGTALEWIKSSYSGSSDNDCVEVAAVPGTVLVRDSKDPDGPRLTFAPDAWAAFLSYAEAVEV